MRVAIIKYIENYIQKASSVLLGTSRKVFRKRTIQMSCEGCCVLDCGQEEPGETEVSHG